jgi:nucleoside-diphosphate-sugar epimerase
VVGRSTTSGKNRIERAKYHCRNLTDREFVNDLLVKLNSDAIIHAASLSPFTGTPNEYEHVTIQGTKTLLGLEEESKRVLAFIYISSSTRPEHINLTKDYPLANTDPKITAYARTKPLAEIGQSKLV